MNLNTNKKKNTKKQKHKKLKSAKLIRIQIKGDNDFLNQIQK